MTRLSVNINKVATLRNARGGNNPDLIHVAKDCERFGGQGITVHPRPDERHITTEDVYGLAEVVTTEYNIEGYPDDRFMKIISDLRPTQATLVPDGPDVLTSNAGWNTLANDQFLKEIIAELKKSGTRVSVFVDPEEDMVDGAKTCGADCIELYTEPYAANFHSDREAAIAKYISAARKANELGLGINAGHDLDLQNLKYLNDQLPKLDEVSIGHALICDAIYYGLENTIQMYLRQLED
ncbi:MAG: pyridoxine 5'-phosphate synthase [Bacteroidota bacterium]